MKLNFQLTLPTVRPLHVQHSPIALVQPRFLGLRGERIADSMFIGFAGTFFWLLQDCLDMLYTMAFGIVVKYVVQQKSIPG